MKALRIAAVAAALILALLAAAAAYLAATFDARRIKAELARIVQEEKQRTLRIDGDLELSFWPDAGFRIGEAWLSERGSEKEFAAIRSARLSVAVKPLFSKQVVVNAAEFEGVRIALVRFEDGSLNIDDLLPRGDRKTPMEIDVAALRIADAEVSWRDEKRGGPAATLSGLNLSTGRLRADTGQSSLDAETLAFSARGEAAGGLEFRLEAPRLTLSEGKAGLERLSGELGIAHPSLPGKRLKLPFEGRLHADMPKQSAKAAFQLRVDESRATLKLDVIRLAPLALRFDLDIDRLSVDKYQPKGKGPARGAPNLSALKGLDARGTIRIGELQVANAKATNVRLGFDARDGLKGPP